MAEAGFHPAGPFIEVEPHPRHNDAFEPALQNCRESAPPGWIHEYDNGGSTDQACMFCDHRVANQLILVVGRPLRLAHCSTKAERVQIEEFDRVASRSQASLSPRRQCVSQAFGARMGNDDQGEHCYILAQPAALCQLSTAERFWAFSRRLLLQRPGRSVGLSAV